MPIESSDVLYMLQMGWPSVSKIGALDRSWMLP